jgi:hypothetical protein
MLLGMTNDNKPALAAAAAAADVWSIAKRVHCCDVLFYWRLKPKLLPRFDTQYGRQLPFCI